ncbi:unnamed protein product [Gemmata massiliana]|uniref:DNA-binding protein n=1 Tax=Gemmata massiliana TaxID=1210884 RepID=A0A6P2DI44_9BACT|nr:helix-turn-helix domain-containing protein [Gemmata massiliana]VTS01497.1 unnamed protein product [Gemmata massiliana]
MSAFPIRLTVSQVAARLPGSRGARRIHPATVIRWILIGCPARNGERVKLPALRVGTRWLIDEVELNAFFAALAANSIIASESPPARVSLDYERAAKAIAVLKAKGV